MTDIDIVAELRNCDYMAACGELNALGSDRSYLREVEKIVYLAEIAMPALLDAVEAARVYRQSEIASKNEFYGPDVSDQNWLAAMAKRLEDQEELDNALAALERSDEG